MFQRDSRQRAHVFGTNCSCKGRHQAFKQNPEGVVSPQPGASERSERHPGFCREASDTPPEGAKAAKERFKARKRGLHRGFYTPLSMYLNASVDVFERSCRCFCPLRGRIGRPSTEPRVPLASLACPGLRACNPFGVLLEPLFSLDRHKTHSRQSSQQLHRLIFQLRRLIFQLRRLVSLLNR